MLSTACHLICASPQITMVLFVLTLTLTKVSVSVRVSSSGANKQLGLNTPIVWHIFERQEMHKSYCGLFSLLCFQWKQQLSGKETQWLLLILDCPQHILGMLKFIGIVVHRNTNCKGQRTLLKFGLAFCQT